MNAAKGFDGCGEETIFRTHGLCKSCLAKWYLTTEKGAQKLSKSVLKATKPRRDLEEYKESRGKEVSLSYLKVNVMAVCHEYIRLRDKGKPCVSCPQPWSPSHQAGHWFKASDFSNLKYHEWNIHNQCQGCNLMKDGNVQEYSIRITDRITPEQKAELEQMAADYKRDGFKWDREELNKLRKYYQDKIKELK